MEAKVRVFEAFLVNMRINLRGGDVGVAQHLLDDPQVTAIVEQVRRSRSAKGRSKCG